MAAFSGSCLKILSDSCCYDYVCTDYMDPDLVWCRFSVADVNQSNSPEHTATFKEKNKLLIAGHEFRPEQ